QVRRGSIRGLRLGVRPCRDLGRFLAMLLGTHILSADATLAARTTRPPEERQHQASLRTRWMHHDSILQKVLRAMPVPARCTRRTAAGVPSGTQVDPSAGQGTDRGGLATG